MLDESHRKHLELIQAVIGRLGNNGFLLKGWAVTLIGVFLGLAVNTNDAGLACVGVVPVLALWSLDAYFLRAERLFRRLFDVVRAAPGDVEPFFMSATDRSFVTDHASQEKTWFGTAWRPALWIFYLGLCAAALVVAAVLLCQS